MENVAAFGKSKGKERDWCNWFTGLCEGEASFTMLRRGNRYMPRFKLCLQRNRSLIEKVNKQFDLRNRAPSRQPKALRLGSKGERAKYTLRDECDASDIQECLRLVKFFRRFPLQYDKQRDVELWSNLVNEAASEKPEAPKLNALALRLTTETERKKGQSDFARVWLRYLLSITPYYKMEEMGLFPKPTNIESARELALQDDNQFQGWALSLETAKPCRIKKLGVFGKDFFRDHSDAKAKRQVIIFSVKAGNLKQDDVCVLDSVMKAQDAAIGGLLSIEEPTAEMKEWAATRGFYTSALNGQKFPRIQLRTIEQLLAGFAIERPNGNVAVDEKSKKAPKAKGRE